MSDEAPPIPAIDPEDRPVTVGRGRGRRPLLVRLLPLLIVVVALGSFAGIVGYYYFAGGGSDGVAPLIKADQQPFKIKPDNPGGIEVPDQDKEIYDRVGQAARGSVPPPTAERLLPPPETPLPRPSPAVPPSPPAAVPAAGAPSAPPPGVAAAATNPPNSNPNVGGPVLGAASSARPSTLSAAPPGGGPSAAPAPAAPTSAAATPQPARPQAAPLAAPAPTQTAAAVPAATRPATGGAVVRAAISSVRSEADAKREWDRQRRLYPQALAGITPEFAPINLGERGVYWRIYVGPAEASSEAQARCAALKQQQVDCFVARP